MEYCYILINDTVVTYSDYDGTFEIPVPKSAKRLVVTFRDYMEEYQESTAVLSFRKGTMTFHKVHLRSEVLPIEFDAEEEKAILIASDDSVEVVIPANSLVDKNGNPKKGKAKVKIQFNDPRNRRDILESPGDFTTMDEDGEEQLLRTYGVLKVKIQDENGQNLGLIKSLQLNINIEKLTGEKFDESEPIPHLWWLDEKTGRWVDAGELKRNNELGKRRKRQLGLEEFWAEIASQTLENFINVDEIQPRCFAKVRAHSQDEGIQNAKVTGIFVNPQGEVLQGSSSQLTDSDGYACISTQCNCDGYLEVEKDGSYFFADPTEVASLPSAVGAVVEDSRRKIKFIPGVLTDNGPVYQMSQERSCRSELTDQSFFSFQSLNNLRALFEQPYNPQPDHKGRYEQSKNVRRCFVKVLTSGTTRTLVKAESYSQNEQIKYGEATKQTEPVNNMPNRNLFAVCLEHRCPERDPILVRFTVVTRNCQTSEVQNALWGKDGNTNLKQNEARVSIPNDKEKSGTDFGIFRCKSNCNDIRQLETDCQNKEIEDAGGDFEGYAVKFDC